MNQKMLELKERIKLNADFRKYSKLIEKQNVTESQLEKYKELESVLFTKHPTLGYKIKTDLFITNIRLYHIAYSMLKGRNYEQIETRVRPNNTITKYEWDLINEIKYGVNE